MSKQTRDMLTQRTKLILPAVQLNDKDLEVLGKQNTVSAVGAADNDVTKGLLGMRRSRSKRLINSLGWLQETTRR